MRAQTSVISIIIITGIIISLVGVVYSWAGPLREKGLADTTFRSASAFVLSLNDKLVDVANSGGEFSADLNPPGGFVRVIPYDPADDTKNSIIFEIPISQQLAFSDEETFLGGTTFSDTGGNTGEFGSSPSIIKLKVQPEGSQWKAIYTITFRKLVDKSTNKEYLIALNEGLTEITGTRKITARLQNTATATTAGVTRTKASLTLSVS